MLGLTTCGRDDIVPIGVLDQRVVGFPNIHGDILETLFANNSLLQDYKVDGKAEAFPHEDNAMEIDIMEAERVILIV